MVWLSLNLWDTYEDVNNLLIVFILVDHRGNDVNLSMIQYYFTDKKHPVYKPPHGNYKSTTPYKRTLPCTFDRMRKLACENAPVATFEQIDKEISNVVGQKSAGSRLWNLQQVVNARRQLNLTHGKSVSPLTEAMELCKSGQNKSNPFVRCVQAAPEPMRVLATDRQPDEMVKNCTDNPDYFLWKNL